VLHDRHEVIFDQAFVDAKIVSERMPVIGMLRCHRPIVDDLRTAVDDLIAAGYEDRLSPSRSTGCCSPRRIGFGRENLHFERLTDGGADSSWWRPIARAQSVRGAEDGPDGVADHLRETVGIGRLRVEVVDDETERVGLDEGHDRAGVEVASDDPTVLRLPDQRSEVVEQISHRTADGFLSGRATVGGRDRCEAGEADLRPCTVDDLARQQFELHEQFVPVHDGAEERPDPCEVLSGGAFDTSLLRCGDESIAAAEVMSDEADGDLGLFSDLGDAKVRLTIGLEVAHGGAEEPFAAVRALLRHRRSLRISHRIAGRLMQSA
jgi:hypothetical protein